MFNVKIRKLNECPTKRSDNDNGYFIVSDTWGTCFFRRASKRDHITIESHLGPNRVKCSYTKIPAFLFDNVFHVYINCPGGFEIQMPKGSALIGLYDAPSWSGNFKNYCYLIYSPTGEAPTIEFPENEEGPVLVFQNGQQHFAHFELLKCNPIRHIYTNTEGWIISKSEFQNLQPVQVDQLDWSPPYRTGGRTSTGGGRRR